MNLNEFYCAPSPINIDGLFAVPIDIHKLEAKVVFDLSLCNAKVEAKMFFVVQEEGNPIFDLRQDIRSAFIDNKEISPEKLKHHDFGGGDNSELIILEQIVKPNVEHTLKLIYELNQPRSPSSKPIGWASSQLFFDFYFTDLIPGRYLEMWFPSNLIYDQFKLELDIEIINTQVEHLIYTNGVITKRKFNYWSITFPETFTSLSHMLGIVPAHNFDYYQDYIILDNIQQNIVLDIFKSKNMIVDIKWVATKIKEHIKTNIEEIGPYIYDKFTAVLWSDIGRSMEYDGGMTVEFDEVSLKHEIFHSWFGRGIKPPTQNDSWLDEAWTTYNTTNQYIIKPLDPSHTPKPLYSLNKFKRITPSNAYTDGPRFFAGLGKLIGDDILKTIMTTLYKENAGNFITTGDLERYITKYREQKDNSAYYFKQFIYEIKNDNA